MASIKFTRSDWEEIIAALESKITTIERGNLGEEDYKGQDKEWIAHLRKILRRIEGHTLDKKLVIIKKAK